jgi:hypothetical protein
MVSQGKVRSARRDDTLRYFQGLITSRRPFFLGVSGVPAPPPDALARLKAARQAFEAALPKAKEAFESRRWPGRASGLGHESLVNAGVPFDAVRHPDLERLGHPAPQSGRKSWKQSAAASHAEKCAGAHLLAREPRHAALRRKRLSGGTRRPVAWSRSSRWRPRPASRRSRFVTSFARPRPRGRARAEPRSREPLPRARGRAHRSPSLVRTSLKQTPYPYEHAAKDATLVKYLIRRRPSGERRDQRPRVRNADRSCTPAPSRTSWSRDARGGSGGLPVPAPIRKSRRPLLNGATGGPNLPRSSRG